MSWRYIKALPAVALVLAASAAQTPKLDTASIERLTGVKGKLDEAGNVFKVSAPRSDLDVAASGVRITPALGLTSWAAFQKAGAQTMVMGDMVVLEDQVSPVMDIALENRLEVTALHNHFFWDSPKVMFMHIDGLGDETILAAAVGKVFSRIKETSTRRRAGTEARIDPAKTTLEPDRIASILGVKGDLKDGVFKVVIGRTTKMHGHEIGSAMGVNTWAAFAGSDDRAVVDGDFAVLGSELQGVLKTLRAAGIHVVAIHNHMVGEEPRIVFLHYWGVGSAASLAKGVRAALDRTRT
ncbi:MAG: DUF1259 domain-containing protein [Thermoanaerobaculia bacterium]